MAIIGQDPFQELAAIREQMDRLLGWRLAERQGTWTPALDVIEGPSEVVLRLELPGVEPDDVHVHLQDSTLTVNGERRLEEQKAEKTAARIERRFGPFERRITLPSGIDAEQVTAEFIYGVLELRVPRKSKPQPQRIEIRWHEPPEAGGVSGRLVA